MSLRGVNTCLDALLDTATIVLSIAVVAWECTARIIAAQKRQMTALASIVDASSERAGLAGHGRVLRAVGNRKG